MLRLSKVEFVQMMRAASELLATAEPFRDWLVRQPAERVVGARGDCCACPLHTFLADNLPSGFLELSVSIDGVSMRTYGPNAVGANGFIFAEWICAKPWQSGFIREIDRTEQKDIEARYALFVLQGVAA